MRFALAGLAALAFAGTAAAQDPLPTRLAIHGGFSNIDAGATETEGSMFGFSTQVATPFGLYLNIGYDLNSTDDDDFGLDVDEGRFGIGYQQRLPYDMRIGIDLNYATIDVETSFANGSVDNDADGISMNINFGADLASNCDFYARLGYVKYDDRLFDVDGPDIMVGIGIKLTGNMRLTMDYRTLQLSDDGGDLDLDNIRAGLRFEI